MKTPAFSYKYCLDTHRYAAPFGTQLSGLELDAIEHQATDLIEVL
jgi:hypothetical protein